jgi:hypothetical protein
MQDDNNSSNTQGGEEKKRADYLTLDEKIFTYQGSRSEFEKEIGAKITKSGMEITYARYSCTDEMTKGFIRLRYKACEYDNKKIHPNTIDGILERDGALKELLSDKRLVLEESVRKNAYGKLKEYK